MGQHLDLSLIQTNKFPLYPIHKPSFKVFTLVFFEAL